MNRFNAYILLDRSGSMQNEWVETIGSINGYVDGLKKAEVQSCNVKVVAFDSSEPFLVLRNTPLDDYTDISPTEISPRGMTPLYDAAGKLILTAAIEGAERNAIIVMTDGLENGSQKYNQSSVKAMIEHVTELGWEVIFLGANFDAKVHANSMGLDTTKYVNTTFGTRGMAMGAMAMKSAAYATTGMAMNYTKEEQEQFEKGKK